MRVNRFKYLICIGFVLATMLITPVFAETEVFKLEAIASFYGNEFHGRPTSSGEIFDMNAMTAAHKTLPFGTMLEVTNLETGRTVVVRVNDRGPFVAGRELDVSRAAALELGMITTGTARVSIRKIISYTPASGETPLPTSETANVAPETTKPVTVEPVDQRAESTKPALTESTGGDVWRIQLGAFKIEENATRLVVKLRQEGFNPAFERSETAVRVVLSGIPEGNLADIKAKLNRAGYEGYLIRKENR